MLALKMTDTSAIAFAIMIGAFMLSIAILTYVDFKESRKKES